MEGVAHGCSSASATLPRAFKAKTITCRAASLSMEKKINYYKILSLDSENVSVDEIKKAYRSMARRCHPDVCPPSRKEESTKMFVELHRAYTALSNPAMRELHDFELRTREEKKKKKMEKTSGLGFGRERWEAQLHELKMRSERKERENRV